MTTRYCGATPLSPGRFTTEARNHKKDNFNLHGSTLMNADLKSDVEIRVDPCSSEEKKLTYFAFLRDSVSPWLKVRH
jgi:hypothetical protein